MEPWRFRIERCRVNLKRLTQFSELAVMAASAGAQEPAQPPAQPRTVIRTETKLVLVDVVATNKKGQYIDDLTQKNFKVWEDNKEQPIKTFSYGPDPSAPDAGKRYLVLYFDSNTLTATELGQARIAAQHFIESNAGPDRLMLVAMHFGNIQILQNFTPDIDKLKASLSKVQAAGVIRGADVAVMGGINGRGGMDDQMMGGPRIDPTQDFQARAMLQGLRGLAKNLGEIPGRKSLILFTSGFPLSNAGRDEATVTISVCNRSNVAIYPVDARGISGLGGTGIRGRAALEFPGPANVKGVALAAWPGTRIAAVLQARGGAG